MNDKQSMKSRIKTTLVLLVVFFCLYIAGRDPYLIEWLASQHFLFIWLPIGLLALLGQKIWAWCVTGGCCFGIVAGQIAENLKNLLYADHPNYGASAYWGAGVWICTVILSVIVGFLMQRRKNDRERI